MELVAWDKKEEGCSKTVNLNLESATFADFKLAASELLLSFLDEYNVRDRLAKVDWRSLSSVKARAVHAIVFGEDEG